MAESLPYKREINFSESSDKVSHRNLQTQKPVLVSRFSKEVTDFSSQYGSETSISYTASNLAGRSNIFPSYGDFTQACVFRTYGPWWKLVPSAPRRFKRTPVSFVSEDYVELSFELEVYPCKIEVWETYNPGAIVRILACDTDAGTDVDSGRVRWQVLWEGKPEKAPEKSRIFSPPLREPEFKTSLIRLEVCSELCHYYTELDCVCMYGTLNPCSDMQAILKQAQRFEVKDDSVLNNAEEIVSQTMQHIKELSLSDQRDITLTERRETNTPVERDITVTETRKINRPNESEITSKDTIQSRTTNDNRERATDELECQETETLQDESENFSNGYFDNLPDEVIQLVLSYLDIPSLCIASRTCRLLKKHCYDSLQYTELNLQPHWTQVNDYSLQCLESRCHHLQHLNLSWCGGNRGIMYHNVFEHFLKSCGQQLTSLYLANCKFINQEAIKIIAENCPKLSDIDLQSCMGLDGSGLSQLTKLKNIQKLNLYRTHIDVPSLIAVIRRSPNLMSLNLGSCSRIHQFDDVARELGKNCKNLRSLDLWRSRTITDIGLRAIADNCPNIEELDLGWCPELKSGTGCYFDLVSKCHKIKKLYLTANRTVCDIDLNAISSNCPDLEQLDILGTRQVSEQAVLRVLESCPNMIMFDVSFCFSIVHDVVNKWSQMFPKCNIKKSFQQ